MNYPDDPLSRHLSGQSPDFSPELHERTMAALRQHHFRQTATSHPSQDYTRWLSTAAAVLLLFAGWWMYSRTSATGPEFPQRLSFTIATPTPDRILRGGSEPFRQAFSEIQPVNQLQRDARSFVRYMAAQLPSVSRPGEKRQAQPL